MECPGRHPLRPALPNRRGIRRTALLAVAIPLFRCTCWVALPEKLAPRRRAFVLEAAVSALLPVASADAVFDNALPQVENYMQLRYSGDAPSDLGLKSRALQEGPNPEQSEGPVLKECNYGPNCFSTTYDPDDQTLPGIMRPWKTPVGMTSTQAIGQLEEIIKGYPPGQNGVDGGGFKIVSVKDNYLYAQFESLKRGRVDDVEFAITTPGELQLRSSGRIGRKADWGSNGKRLNYISAKLREQGWEAPEITKDTHEYYFRMNSGKTAVQCTGVNCPVNYELVPEEPNEKTR